MKKGQRLFGLVLGVMIGLSLLTVSVLAAMDAAETPVPEAAAGGETPVLYASGDSTSATSTPIPTPTTTATAGNTAAPTPVPTEEPNKIVSSGVCGEGLSWALTGAGVLTISGQGAMADYEAGGAPWYDRAADIETVWLEEGVTSVGTNAFCDCVNLAEVTISYGVTALGDGAFLGCAALTAVYYTGPEQSWASVAVGEGNASLQKVEPVSLYGDVNGDRAVNGKDVVRLMRCVLGGAEASAPASGDYDGSGSADIRDVIRLLRWFAGGAVLE